MDSQAVDRLDSCRGQWRCLGAWKLWLKVTSRQFMESQDLVLTVFTSHLGLEQMCIWSCSWPRESCLALVSAWNYVPWIARRLPVDNARRICLLIYWWHRTSHVCSYDIHASFQYKPDVCVILYYRNPPCVCLHNSVLCLAFVLQASLALSLLNMEMRCVVSVLHVQPQVLPCLDKLCLFTSLAMTGLVVLVRDLSEICPESLWCCRKTFHFQGCIEELDCRSVQRWKWTSFVCTVATVAVTSYRPDDAACEEDVIHATYEACY